jgi:hypothetical protein
MDVWRCPLCRLEFSFRTELDWHIRQSHCSHGSAVHARAAHGAALLTWARLRQLQSVSDNPSVSLLLPTSPGKVMTSDDSRRLRQLAGRARHRLALEIGGDALRRFEHRLLAAVHAAEAGSTDEGLALLVSISETAIVPLPFAPVERAVVDPVFATRDLLEALQRFPPYRTVVLAGAGFRVMEGTGNRLRTVCDWHIQDMSVKRLYQALRPSRRLGGWPWSSGHPHRQVLEAADRALYRRVAVAGDLPLVAIGRKDLLANFRRHSVHAPSLVGEVVDWGSVLPTEVAGELAAPKVIAWRIDVTTSSLPALDEAEREGSVAWGLADVWRAVQAHQVTRLWVEHDYSVSARVSGDSHDLVVAVETGVPGPAGLHAHFEAPGVADDVVDEIIDLVARDGGDVELVDHLLHDHEGARIAAQLSR